MDEKQITVRDKSRDDGHVNCHQQVFGIDRIDDSVINNPEFEEAT